MGRETSEETYRLRRCTRRRGKGGSRQQPGRMDGAAAGRDLCQAALAPDLCPPHPSNQARLQGTPPGPLLSFLLLELALLTQEQGEGSAWLPGLPEGRGHGCLRIPQSYRAAASLAPSEASAGAGGTGRWRLCRKEADASSGHHLAQAKAAKEDIPPSAPQVLGHRLQLGLWGSVPVLKLLLPDTSFHPRELLPARTYRQC